jgi:hypothetical protein
MKKTDQLSWGVLLLSAAAVGAFSGALDAVLGHLFKSGLTWPPIYLTLNFMFVSCTTVWIAARIAGRSPELLLSGCMASVVFAHAIKRGDPSPLGEAFEIIGGSVIFPLAFGVVFGLGYRAIFEKQQSAQSERGTLADDHTV